MANVDLEPTNLGLRVACSTDWARRPILKLQNFDFFQCALSLLISCIPLSNSELFPLVILFSKEQPNVGLEPTTLGLRVPCSTDWASRAILTLRIFDGFQWALVLVMLHLFLSFKAVLQCWCLFKRCATFGTQSQSWDSRSIVALSEPTGVYIHCSFLMVFSLIKFFELVCSCLHFRIVLLLFRGFAQLGILEHGPWIKRSALPTEQVGTRDAANNWCYTMYLSVNATVLSALRSFSLEWLFVLNLCCCNFVL